MHQAVRLAVLPILISGILAPSIAAQQDSSSTGVTAQLIVTVEGRHGSAVPVIKPGDVMVYEGHDRDQVTGWVPFQDSNAGLELFILLDDGLSTSVGSQLSDLQKFITAQPATTAIGIGYMRDGTVSVAQNPTTNHAQAAKALRLPLGERGVSPSPYLSLTDMLKRWPQQQVRREVLMISDGIDTVYGRGGDDPYLDQAIAQTQAAKVVVYSIYAPAAGHFGHTFWRINWGQNYLSQLSDETGGESYGMLISPAVSFMPYLEDLSQKLNRQYLLTFIPKPEKKAGERKVKLMTEVPNADLVAADRVYVPAT